MQGFMFLMDRAEITEPLAKVPLLPNAGSSRIDYPHFLATHGNSVYAVSLLSSDEEANTIAGDMPNYMTQPILLFV